MRPHEEHRAKGPREASFWVVTVSTSRYEAASRGEAVRDESGDVAAEMIKEAGHKVLGRTLIKDDVYLIRETLMELLKRGDVDVIVFTGGTGIAKSDVTVEALRPLLDKELEGFGELFRWLSYNEVGSAAIMSRALAGVVAGRLVVVLPGSPNAVRTGLRLILPEVPHILYLARS